MEGMSRVAMMLALVLFAVLAWQSLRKQGSTEAVSPADLLQEISRSGDSQLVQPIPQALDLDPRKLALGERLFREPRLSGKGFSCNTCHPLESGGMDGLPRSLTINGGRDQMNTPTLFNAAFYPYLQWRADQPDLAAQLDAVIANPLHMASSWPAVEEMLREDPGYREAFRDLYDSEPTRQLATDALVTFEQSLITPDSDFDRWLRGDEKALTEQQRRGFGLFQQYGCSSCHQGINLGGNLVARFGVFGSAFNQRELPLNEFDQGRMSVTGNNADRFLFRVPGLRNVAVTAPYFHDGSVDSLEEAVEKMGLVQLGVDIPAEDRADIVAFLRSLTGEYRGRRL